MSKYAAMAKSRTAHVLQGRGYGEASRVLRRNARRLLAWRRVDRRYAERMISWAEISIKEHCK